MSSRNVFLPRKVQQQLSTLHPNDRIALELHLENLEHYVSAGSAAMEELRNRLTGRADGDRFVTQTGGLEVVFTIDPHSKVLYVQEIRARGEA
jgi:hypothetical protein